jgi:hypothetical protein
MRALLVVLGGLVLAGAVGAAGEPLTVLPKPRFNAPATAPRHPRVMFRVVSSSPVDPGRTASSPRPRGLRLTGADGSSARLVVAPGRYAFDFRNYAWPPRIAPGEREFVFEEVVWAKEDADILFVETAHSTYARSSYGLNGYLNAIDLKRKKLLWRTPALVANAGNFVLLERVLVSGYGFTAEPDYLYAIDRANGHVVGRLLLPSAAELIVRHGTTLTVETYDHRLVVRVVEP